MNTTSIAQGSKSPRRSSRPRKTRGNLVHDEAVCAPDENYVPSTKAKKQRKKAGRLRLLPEMPLDVLYEIFRNVTPRDLMRLSWTTKALRDLVMTRRARWIWWDAIAAVPGLPPCPSWLNEPQYTRLVYDPHCHICGKGCKSVLWEFCMRACRSCFQFDDQFVVCDGKLLESGVFATVWDERMMEYRALLSDFVECRKQSEAIQGGDMTPWFDAQVAHVEEVQEFAALCRDWSELAQEERTAEIDSLKQQRRDAIVVQLRALGYGRAMDFISSLSERDHRRMQFDKHKHVAQTRELTTRIWSHIKNDLLELMEVIEQARVDAVFEERLDARISLVSQMLSAHIRGLEELDFDKAIPQATDICLMDEVLPILESTVEETDVDAAMEELVAVLRDMPALVARWRTSAEVYLESLVQSTTGSDPKDSNGKASSLNLAKNVFTCRVCSSSPSFWGGRELPAIWTGSSFMRHRCTDAWWGTGLDIQGLSSALHDAFMRNGDDMPWFWTKGDLSRVAFLKNMSHLAVDLLQAAGLDPDTATPEDMDARPIKFTCHTCDVQVEDYTWRETLFHALNMHDDLDVTSLAAFTYEEI